MWDSRSNRLEIIDLGPDFYTKEEYNDCLEQLGKIGKWLGGDRATLSAFSKICNKQLSILDVGCGGGIFAIKLARQYSSATVLGIDINPYAIEFASKKLSSFNDKLHNINFEIRSEAELNEPTKSFDIVTSTLVCHHLPEEALITFIYKACRIAKKKVIINDLHRHPLALLLFKIICPLYFRNRLVHHDGALSIQRAFKRHDWVSYLERAGIKKSHYTIKWHWAFRWIVEINCEELTLD